VPTFGSIIPFSIIEVPLNSYVQNILMMNITRSLYMQINRLVIQQIFQELEEMFSDKELK
jgi:hypothetical protein